MNVAVRDNAARHRLMLEAIQGSERLLLLETTLRHNDRLVAQRDKWINRARELESQVACLLGLLAKAYPGEITAEADLFPGDVDGDELEWPSMEVEPPHPQRDRPRPTRPAPARQVAAPRGRTVMFAGEKFEISPEFQRQMEEFIAKPLPDPAAYDRTIGRDDE